MKYAPLSLTFDKFPQLARSPYPQWVTPALDTIVAVATPPGRGGIGIVRLSGPAAQQIAAPLLRLRSPLAANRARFAELLDTATGDVLDEAVVTLFTAPNSYTGDDVVEIAAHGAPVLLSHLVRLCCDRGARLAEPGEFTRRAFLAGRIDLTQAEAVDDLIGATTLEQSRLAARQLGGALARTVQPIKQELVELIAALEAGIDFAEDDIDLLPASAIARALAHLHRPLLELAASFTRGRIVRDGLRLAIVGRPNAGKSSLFNCLVERDRAIVTATPGTTRDLVTERVAIGGIPVELVDTAGLRETTDETERLGIAKSREALAEADVVLLVVDAVLGLGEQDRQVIESIHGGRSLLLAWNKCDLIGREREVNFEGSADVACVATSAVSGAGIQSLRAAIVAAAGAGSTIETATLTNLRQHQAVAAALRGVEAAAAAAEADIPHEMLLLDLYDALRGLDLLNGATTNEDVLRLIFAKFCIGK